MTGGRAAKGMPFMFSGTLTLEQVAERYGISMRNVAKLLRSGELTGVNVGVGKRNKRWRIRPQDIEAFERRRLSTPAPAAARRRRRTEQESPSYTRFFAEE
jgi:excisionase family DNA binding protein